MTSQTTIQDVIRGFDDGEMFTSEQQVREYFTVSNYREQFGQCAHSQDDLDAAAQHVIDGRLHCAF